MTNQTRKQSKSNRIDVAGKSELLSDKINWDYFNYVNEIQSVSKRF